MSTNRFSVLCLESEEDEEESSPDNTLLAAAGSGAVGKGKRIKPAHAVCGYSLIVGTQQLLPVSGHPLPIPAVNTSSASVNLSSSSTMPALNTPSFFGRCFQCQYMSHSQKYCPLRMCRTCKQFGHSEIVCQKYTHSNSARHHQNSNTRFFSSRSPSFAKAVDAEVTSLPCARFPSGIRVTSNAVDETDGSAVNDFEEEMVRGSTSTGVNVEVNREEEEGAEDAESCA